MRGLTDKTVLVTGAGGGFGRAIAVRLAEEGATVAVNDVDADRAEETVRAVEEALAADEEAVATDQEALAADEVGRGGGAFPAIADVTDRDAVTEMVDEVADSAGLDVLVNNAGWDRMAWFLEQDPDDWERIIAVNYRGQVNCARAAGEYLADDDAEGGGALVAIASDAGRIGSSGEAVYAGTKGGVIAFTKTLAREWARDGVRCNVVAPGPADTPMTRAMREESDLADRILGAMADQTPLGRMVDPSEVAAAVAFLASEDASFVTGQVLSVSGGLTMVD